MNRLELELGDRDAANALVRTAAVYDPALPVVKAGTIVVAGGEPVMAVVRLAADARNRMRRAMLSYPMDSTVRAAGVRNRSRVFGYGARQVMMQRNACRACSGADQAPEAHAAICRSAVDLAALYAEVLPEHAERDRETAEAAVLPDWRIGGTQWTSGVLNHTSALPYHYDRNNLEPVWSAMVVCRRGARGGLLHVPELGANVECRDGDVVFFPGWRFVHGVTPVTMAEPGAYRFTAVFYAVRNMKACLPFDLEVERGRAERTQREADLRPADERVAPPSPSAVGKRRGGIPQGWRRGEHEWL